MSFLRWLIRIGFIWVLAPLYYILGALVVAWTMPRSVGGFVGFILFFSGTIIVPSVVFPFFKLLSLYFRFDFSLSDYLEECDFTKDSEITSTSSYSSITKDDQPIGDDGVIAQATRRASNNGANTTLYCDYCGKHTQTYYPNEYTDKGRYCAVCNNLK